MKLKDVKKGIDLFFDDITADQLYEISILKYGFSEISYNLEDVAFETAKVSYYLFKNDNSIFDFKENEVACNLPIAA